MWQDLQTDVLLSTQPGNGGFVNFGETNDGTMYVFATNTITGCTNTMANTITISSLATPIVDITANAPTTGCGTVTVTLSTPYETGCTYQWSSNTQGNIPGATSNTYMATVSNTTKVFTCTATNANDCEASDFIVLTSNPYPTQFAVTTSTPTFCPGEGIVTVNGTTSGGDVVYHLSFGGTTINTITGTGAAYNWTGLSQTGTYTVTAENVETGCELVMGSAYISMNPSPAAAGAITGPTSVCQNATATYSVASIANADSYYWVVPNWVTIISGQGTNQITVTVNQNGMSGSVSVRGHNSVCDTDGTSSSVSLTVMSAPVVNVSASPLTICEGSGTTLTATGGNFYGWSNSLGANSSVWAVPSNSTTYYVTVTNGDGCTASGNVSVTVNQMPDVSIINVPTHACAGDIVNLYADHTGGIWDLNGDVGIDDNTLNTDLSGTGTKTLRYTYTEGGCTAIATQYITIFALPTTNWLSIPTVYVNTPAFNLMPYVSQPTSGDYTASFSGPGVNGNVFNPATAGVGMHMIYYTCVSGFTGCSVTHEFYIDVLSGDDPGNSVESVAAANAVAIYPNPASEILNLTGINTQEIISLQVIDITGRVIYENENLDEDIQINLDNFLPGNYMIRFFDTDGMTVCKKFMKN